MRVIVLHDFGFVNGGAAQVAINGVNGLADAGIDVTFVYSVGHLDPSIDKDRVKAIAFGYHDLLSNPSRTDAVIRGLWDTRCADRLREVLAAYDPQDTILHLHSWVQSFSSSIVPAALDMGFRIVCTLHDYFTVCPTGGFFNFSNDKLCELKPMSLSCIASNCDPRSYPQKLWRVTRQAIQKNIGGIPRDVKHFITVSEYSESLMRSWFPADAQFFRIGNPINIEKMDPPSVGINNAFTYVGRLALEKGAVLFAEAAKLSGVRAVYAGSGPAEVEVLASNPSASLLGWCSRSGVVDAIRSSRALVFPSLVRETQGMAVLEAAALGVPAVVSDTCAAREAIIDGETGLLFRAGDTKDLAAKLSSLQNDPAYAARLGRAAYEHYWKNPVTRAIHVRKLIDCYGQILGEPSQ